MIVTIDGPAGSGKSTVARLLADRLNIGFLDTGAMYRAIALAVLKSDHSENDDAAVSTIAAQSSIRFENDCLHLNNVDVSEDIRTPEVTAVSSVIAANPAVRERLVELQREIGAAGSIVTEGRDQGSIVFPNAKYKFFLTATVDARARRRHREMVSKGSSLTLATVKTQLRQRDQRDESRAHAPMKPAADARKIDTSSLSIAQVVEALMEIILEGKVAAGTIQAAEGAEE